MSGFADALRVLRRDGCLNVFTVYILIILTVAAGFVKTLLYVFGWVRGGVRV